MKKGLILLLSAAGLLAPGTSLAQTPATVLSEPVPSAPAPQNASTPGNANLPSPAASSSVQSSSAQSSSRDETSPGAPTPLSLKDAEVLALKNNPQISVARLLALASHQVTREARSNLWPTAVGNITGVDAEAGSRITAGMINNPSVYERAAAGLMVTQLITDFGRTTNLISSANYAEKAENQNAAATKQQILLAVNQAFFNALQAQAVLTVAEQTVKERQTVADQIGALYKSKLKSELDFSFANVNLAQAQLLLLDAENNQNAVLATLSMVLGFPTQQNFQPVEEPGATAPPVGNVDDLTALAFTMRPEILSLQFQYESAKKFQTAERDLLLPSLQAMGGVGVTPVGNSVVAPNANAFNNTYGVVGANLEIPLFNGFLFSARAKEASLKAQATDERLRDMRDLISRDVRLSWLNANTAYQRLAVTQQLLDQAKLGLSLAQSRYNLGLASIVELSQAQLQETQAEITNVGAGYDYRLALAVLQYQTKGI
jgi:outer membrane protein